MQHGREVLGLLSPAGQPYNPMELHTKYAATTPRELYSSLCKSCKCKSIPAVSLLFPDTQGAWGNVTALDLSTTYVGPKGVVPVVEMCKVLPNVSQIIISENYLTNESVWYLCKMALFHPSITSLDVSKNPISWTGAMCIVELITKNTHVCSVLVGGTSMPPNVVEAIQSQTLKNASIGSRRSRRGVNPCNHPTTIRQRALKRYFHDIAGGGGSGRSTGDETVPRARLTDGLKEMWKVSGREREITQRTPLFYENFNKRACQDNVPWEEFLILIMLEDVLYNPILVEKLHTIFNQFDLDGGGYVEVRALRGMMTQLSPTLTPPSQEELQAKMHYYDLDESMTLTWDEFLLLLYDHGPVVGSKAELTSTPLPSISHAHHH